MTLNDAIQINPQKLNSGAHGTVRKYALRCNCELDIKNHGKDT